MEQEQIGKPSDTVVLSIDLDVTDCDDEVDVEIDSIRRDWVDVLCLPVPLVKITFHDQGTGATVAKTLWVNQEFRAFLRALLDAADTATDAALKGGDDVLDDLAKP